MTDDSTEAIDAQLELTRINLSKLLAALDADQELVEDPEKNARLKAHLGSKQEKEKYAELANRSAKQRRGDKLATIMKGVAAAAEAAGAQDVKALHEPDGSGSGLDDLKRFLGKE